MLSSGQTKPKSHPTLANIHAWLAAFGLLVRFGSVWPPCQANLFGVCWLEFDQGPKFTEQYRMLASYDTFLFYCRKSMLHCLKRCEKRVRLSVRKLSKNILFNWIVLVFVFFNSVTMALYKYGQDEKIRRFLGKMRFETYSIHFFLQAN